MRLYGLIGHPLTHSFSKKYFTEKFAKEGIVNCNYELFSIPSVIEITDVLKTPGLRGLNVTIPYKEEVMSFLTESNELVQEIGACNCIKIQEGKLIGFNTDAVGFEQSLKEFLLPADKKALILGTGGASKAAKFVLKKLGIAFSQISRTPGKGQISYKELDKEIMDTHELIINTTPVGTFPKVDEAPDIPYQFITGNHYLFDMVYNPEKTLFLEQGASKGARVKNGYDMLVLQAEESWRIWNQD